LVIFFVRRVFFIHQLLKTTVMFNSKSLSFVFSGILALVALAPANAQKTAPKSTTPRVERPAPARTSEANTETARPADKHVGHGKAKGHSKGKAKGKAMGHHKGGDQSARNQAPGQTKPKSTVKPQRLEDLPQAPARRELSPEEKAAKKQAKAAKMGGKG
jgi:hypothetical protein